MNKLWECVRIIVGTLYGTSKLFYLERPNLVRWRGEEHVAGGQPHPMLNSGARASRKFLWLPVYMRALMMEKITTFCMVRPRMLTRDLFAIANLLVDIRQRKTTVVCLPVIGGGRRSITRWATANRSRVSIRVTNYWPWQGWRRPCKIFLSSNLTGFQNVVAVCHSM